MIYENDPFDGLSDENPPPPPEPSVRMATQGQQDYIAGLLAKKDLCSLPPDLMDIAGQGTYTFRDAGLLIDRLKALPWLPAESAPITGAPEGIHWFDGEVYKVQVAHHGSGKTYAKKLVVDDEQDPLIKSTKGRWLYIGRGHPYSSLSESTLMTLEQAKEFGKLYGMCCQCGATLTDEVSIAAGIGPVCARRF